MRLKRPDIPPNAFQALEQMGHEPVQALLSSGQVGYGSGADIPIGQIKVTRSDVEKWLQWKSRQFELWTRIGVIAAVLAAIFSFITMFR